MKIRVVDIQQLAKVAKAELKKAKDYHRNIEGSEGPSDHINYDIGYYEGRLHQLGEIYNLIRRQK